jgi:hypothetical protein
MLHSIFSGQFEISGLTVVVILILLGRLLWSVVLLSAVTSPWYETTLYFALPGFENLRIAVLYMSDTQIQDSTTILR